MARSQYADLIIDENGNLVPRNAPRVIDARAPQHDFSKDVPMSPLTPYQLTGNSLTPKSVWDATFRNRFTGTNPLAPQPIQASAPATLAPIQPLSVLAAGGQNHAEKWMNPNPPPASLNQFSTTPGDARAIANQYGTGTASTTFDSTPGTRQPFIAGANGVNVGPAIAASGSRNDPTLNRNYVNRANGVPNLLSPIPASQPDWKKQFSWSSAFAQ